MRSLGVLGQNTVLTVLTCGDREIGPREEAEQVSDREEAGIGDESTAAGFGLPDSRKD